MTGRTIRAILADHLPCPVADIDELVSSVATWLPLAADPTFTPVGPQVTARRMIREAIWRATGAPYGEQTAALAALLTQSERAAA